MALSTDVIFVGNIIHCDKPFKVCVLEKGFIAVKEGKIASIDSLKKLEDYRKTAKNVSTIQLTNSQILIPGLIDTHIHAFQYPIIGIGMNVSLFSWLNQHIDKLEQKFKDLEYAKKVFDAIVKKTLSYGTTTACYNATAWTDATLVLVDSAIKYGQRALVGKVNVTVGMPGHLVETIEESITDTKRLINEIAKRKTDLVEPIITPGSALNVTTKDIPLFAELAKKHNLNLQAHMNETIDGKKQLESMLGGDHKNFTHTQEILTERTIFAHCVHMRKEEILKLAESGSAIAHCPNSNFNLLSGICDVRAFLEAGVKVGLGTDVSGGCSLSIMNAMRYAITASAALSFTKRGYKPINYFDAFYLATLGGAKALSMDDKIGNFEVGKEFDALIVDLDVQNGPVDVFEEHTALELLQKFIFTADDRNVTAVYVAGNRVK